MDRDIPTYNPLVVNRIQQKNLQLHQQRLQNIKSVNQSRISTSSSNNYRQNRKALQVEEQKKTQIQRNNLILFNKMQKIMKRADPSHRNNLPCPRNNIRTSMELNRLQEQNRTMYERLEKQKPTIDNRKLFEQRKKQENILRFLGKYSAHSLQNAQVQSFRASEQPKQKTFYPPSKITRAHYLQKMGNEKNQGAESKGRYQQFQLQEEIDERQFNAHIQNVNRTNKVHSSYQTQPQLTQKTDLSTKFDSIHTKEFSRGVPFSAKDIILYKIIKQISGQKLQVKIVRSHNSYEIRAISVNEEHSDPIKIILSQSEGNKLLEQHNYDYKSIVSRLVIFEGHLQIDDECSSVQSEQKQNQESFIHRNQPQKPQKVLVGYFNPSHISEQNQEESYRPPCDLIQKASPSKNNPRIDSLGQQVVLQEEPSASEHCKESQVHIFQQIENKCDNINPPQIQKREIEVTFNPALPNKYEQALDEQII